MKNKQDMQVIMVNIVNIKPYTNNPRYNQKSIMLLEEAITRFGFLVPITVDKDYVIVTGHSRYNAARNLDLEEVPVIVLDLSERELREFRLADNKVGEFTYLDLELKGDKLVEYAKDDELMQFAFPEYAPDITISVSSTQNLEDTERSAVLECICPDCMHEFDAITGNPLEDEEE